MTSIDVIVAGELFTDLILGGFDFWPEPGQEALATSFCREAGGGAAITAAGLARLGGRVAVLGVVGNDGDWLEQRLRQLSIETATLLRHPHEPTAITVAVTGPSDRAFFTYPGANRGFLAAVERAVRDGLLRGARHVHLAFPPPLDSGVELVRQLREQRCTVSLDVGWHEAWLRDPRAIDIIRSLDLFFPNESEAAAITAAETPEAMLAAFERLGLRRIALKLGSRGGGLLWDGRTLFAAPPQVHAVDTTGAGDSFDAGFIDALLRHASPEECLRAAVVCGALSTQAMGGIAAFPTRERLNTELRKINAHTAQ